MSLLLGHIVWSKKQLCQPYILTEKVIHDAIYTDKSLDRMANCYVIVICNCDMKCRWPVFNIQYIQHVSYILFGTKRILCTVLYMCLHVCAGHCVHAPALISYGQLASFCCYYTVCLGSSDPFYVVTYCIKWVTTTNKIINPSRLFIML